METSTISQELYNFTEIWYYNDYYNDSGDSLNETDTSYTVIHFTYVFISLQTVLGLIGNMISLIVWIKGKQCSSIACSTYFICLAISDILALLSYCWICVVYDLLFTGPHTAAYCNMTEFFFFFAPELSSWLVVCISVERFLSLKFPFTFTPNGAKTRAKIAFLALSLFMIGINSHAFVADFDNYNYNCFPRDGYVTFSDTMYELSSVWILTVVPFCLIMTCNMLILVQLCLRNRTNALNRTQSNQRVAMFTKFSITSGVLLAVSLAPSMVFELANSYQLVTDDDWNALLHASNNTLCLNNCLNFLVYCFSSTQFRSDLRRLCTVCSKRQRDAEITADTPL